MAVEVMGIDHVFAAVRDLRVSERFYDRVMNVLGSVSGRCPQEAIPTSSTTTVTSRTP